MDNKALAYLIGAIGFMFIGYRSIRYPARVRDYNKYDNPEYRHMKLPESLWFYRIEGGFAFAIGLFLMYQLIELLLNP